MNQSVTTLNLTTKEYNSLFFKDLRVVFTAYNHKKVLQRRSALCVITFFTSYKLTLYLEFYKKGKNEFFDSVKNHRKRQIGCILCPFTAVYIYELWNVIFY